MTQYSDSANFSTGFSSQCFPVRSLSNYKRVDEGGAWLVAYRAEQRRRFKAVLSNEPISQLEPNLSLINKRLSPEPIEESANKLDGFYLMRKFYVEDPCDLCSVNISGSELSKVSEGDFLLFNNVVHVDAGDNNLPFNAFKNFLSLRELEMPLNNISGSIRLEPHDFLYLEKLDLSYNRVTTEDILDLGLLPCLKTLHLTGNEIKRLPIEMARTYRAITGITFSGTVESEDRKVRFSNLENLFLDNNELTDVSTFSSLAGLRRLRYLNLENNEITSIPHLRLLGARVRQSAESTSAPKSRESAKQQDELTNQNEQRIPEEREVETKDDSETDKDELVLDENDEMLIKTLPGNKEEVGSRMGLRQRSSTLTEDASLLGDKYNPPLPFSSLLHLNLANNTVFEEEGLLAIMGWPQIKELVIWGNPLTTAFKGDPPLISIQLGKLKGVRIFRQKPIKRPKHHVNLSNIAGYRKVDDALPPVPRKRDILMLEGPFKPDAISYVGPYSRPLPPISAPSGTQRRSRSHPVTPRQPSTAPTMTDTYSKDFKKTNGRSRSVPPEPPQMSRQRRTGGHESVKTTGEPTSSVDTTNTRQHEEAAKKTQTDEGFFMTQIDEPETLETPGDTGIPRSRKKKSRKAKHQHPDRPFSVEAKYKGYEDLLDVDENNPDTIIPKGIQESVRSLQYTLQHPLLFTESQGNYKETPSKKKVEPKTKVSRQNKVEEMSNLLDKMRIENKTIESNLENVLQDYHKDPKIRKQFPKAKKLLDEVQAKYNEVRMNSLRPSAVARRLLQPELVREPSEVESLGSSFLEEEKHVLDELAKFKQRLDERI